MSSALVVIPTYNEKENVARITDCVFSEVPEAHVLIVDDSSPDGTGELADQMAARDERIHVLHRKEKQGLGRAYIAGFQWALERDYEFIFEMDADLSHEPSAIPGFLENARSADLVLGSRYVGGIRVLNWPLHRLLLSMGAGIYVRWITGMPFSDPTGGYKCFRRAVLETLDLSRIQSNGYSFQIEVTHQAWIRGFQIVDHPITFIERRSGESKMSASIVREALWRVWLISLRRLFRRRPPAPHAKSVAGTKKVFES